MAWRAVDLSGERLCESLRERRALVVFGCRLLCVFDGRAFVFVDDGTILTEENALAVEKRTSRGTMSVNE